MAAAKANDEAMAGERRALEAEWAAKPAWVAPWQRFAAELGSIAWLPVHRDRASLADPTMALLPWPR